MVIPVANASLAVTLAEFLNRDEGGQPLPEGALTKLIPPFSAVSLDTGVGPPFFVLWSNSFARRFVALTYERADAERFAAVLNRADYPVHVSPWKVIWQMSWPSVASDDKDLARLEEPTLPPAQIKRPSA